MSYDSTSDNGRTKCNIQVSCVVLGESCNDPGTPAGAEQIATSYKEGKIVTFNCTRPGFKTSNNLEWKCEAKSNAVGWSRSEADLPKCVGEFIVEIVFTREIVMYLR